MTDSPARPAVGYEDSSSSRTAGRWRCRFAAGDAANPATAEALSQQRAAV